MSAKTPELIAYLSVRDTAAMIEFYQNAFGAELTPPTLIAPNGVIVHAEMILGGVRMMLAEEHPESDCPSPLTLGGATSRLTLEVADAVATYSQALNAGAEVVLPLQEQFYGHIAARLRDPSGHFWIITQEIEKVSEEEMQRRMDEVMGHDTEG